MFKTWEDVFQTQESVKRILTNSISLGRVSHSYIFDGPKGTKKRGVAILFAKTLLCTNRQNNNPCNQCHNCVRVDHLTHPNLFLIDPPGKVIKKEVITSLIQELSKASLEKGPRIYIVIEAERFNQSSANTLLKTMEEPGQEVYQILITENSNTLLSTILSRAEIIRFIPINRKVVKEHLLMQGTSETLANIISQYTADIETAEKLGKDKNTDDIFKLVIEIYENMLIKDRSSVIAFFQNEKILSDYEKVDFFLNLITFYQNDILNAKLHAENLIFSDQKETIQKLAKKITKRLAQDYLEMMLDLANRLKFNINTQLAFNKLIVTLERGYKYATHSRSDSV